jgi:hypothetical protein
MARKRTFGAAVSIAGISLLGFVAAPGLAGAAPASTGGSALVGVLGFEGGAFPPAFHPTAGTVVVDFTNPPLVLLHQVGSTGHFRIDLGPGNYTVTGCGPSSTGGTGLCGKPKNITLKPGEIDHVRLVWAMVP